MQVGRAMIWCVPIAEIFDVRYSQGLDFTETLRFFWQSTTEKLPAWVQEWQHDPTAKLWFSQISDYIKSSKDGGRPKASPQGAIE